MTIEERAREICRRLTRDVADVAPKGIGRWDRAWEIVDGPSASFMLALSTWEADPTSEAAKQAVRDNYRAVVEAWRRAAEEFTREEAGR